MSIGFAISAPTVTDVVEQLIQEGQVSHAFLGIEPRPITPERPGDNAALVVLRGEAEMEATATLDESPS